MTVYELTGAAAELYEMLQNEEIDEQTFKDTLDAMGAEEKIDGCVKVIKQLETDKADLKAEADRLTKRAKSAENGAKRIRESLVAYLQATDQSKIKTLLFTVSKRATQSINIADNAELPEQYIKVKTEADKTALKNALLKGEQISGVSLNTNYSLTIK